MTSVITLSRAWHHTYISPRVLVMAACFPALGTSYSFNYVYQDELRLVWLRLIGLTC